MGTISEHSMPFTYAPILVDLAKELASDPKALSQLSLDRRTASYKTTYGMGECYRERLVTNLKTTPFSMNLDESTSANNKHILTVLVSYYNSELSTVVYEHWESVELVKLDSGSIYESIVQLMETNQVPWEKLVSVLMDSCNVMRGKKSGVETRLRENKAPHLLDVDGDSCHHVHNSVKRFSQPFQSYLEDLFTDIHNDFKWSTDQKELLQEVCELLNIKYTTPERFLEHRWLSAFDLSSSTSILMDAYLVIYHAFLSKEDKSSYLSRLVEMFQRRNVGKEARDRLREIRAELSKKKMTDLGKKRKQRICEKIFYTDLTTTLYINFYLEVLPLLKGYVLTFQSANVKVHQLHDKQLEMFKRFLACFMKIEHLTGKTARQLKDMDLSSDKGQFMKQKDMFVGRKINTIVKESPKDSVVQSFLDKASAAYIQCAGYMQKTLPLDNPLLRSLSAIDPVLTQDSVGIKELRKLGDYFQHLLSEEEQAELPRELVGFGVDSSLPPRTEEAVEWWTAVFRSSTYPTISKVVMASISIFHGPLVESSFNVMGDVIGTRSGSMNTETYSSIQTVKYALRARKTTALKHFHREDKLFGPVDRRLCIKLRAAAGQYKKKNSEASAKKAEIKKQYSLKKKLVSKSAMKQNILATQESNFQSHLINEAKRAKERKMQEILKMLCAKRQKKN